MTLPDTVDALIDLLDTQAFPLRNFSADMPFHAIHRELGKRDVVDFLRALQKERAERALRSPLTDTPDDDNTSVWAS
jgi:hypothetical protein